MLLPHTSHLRQGQRDILGAGVLADRMVGNKGPALSLFLHCFPLRDET